MATSLWGLAIAGTRGETEIVGADDDELHVARKDLAAMELQVLSALSYRLTASYLLCLLFLVPAMGVDFSLYTSYVVCVSLSYKYRQ